MLLIFIIQFTGTECPSPLLGVCPPCENCTSPPTRPPTTDEPSMFAAKYSVGRNNPLPQPIQQTMSGQPLQSPANLKTHQVSLFKSGPKAQNIRNKSSKKSSQFSNSDKAMLVRSNFIFPWLRTVELYRKKRDIK